MSIVIEKKGPDPHCGNALIQRGSGPTMTIVTLNSLHNQLKFLALER